MPDRLFAGQSMAGNTMLMSAAGQYRLVYQNDGNLVVYGPQDQPTWHSRSPNTSVGQALMQADGNFVVYDATGWARWASRTNGNPGAWVVMQDDGNLVVYSAANAPLWNAWDDLKTSWWDDFTGFLKDAGDAVVGAVQTVANAVVDTVESVLSPFLNLIGAFVGLIFSIPFVGRLIAWLWNTATDLFYRGLSAFETVFVITGFMPEKRLRLLIVNQRDRIGLAASNERIKDYLRVMIDVYMTEARVRVLPALPFSYSTPFSGPAQDLDKFIVEPDAISSQATMIVSCEGRGAVNDLGLGTQAGSEFQAMMSTGSGFWGAFRRIIGTGAPLTVFAVRGITGNKDGCSNGPPNDFVAVQFIEREPGDPTGLLDPTNPDNIATLLTMAHECGHACGMLWHDDDTLMESGKATRKPILTAYQKMLLRTSRHVAYL